MSVQNFSSSALAAEVAASYIRDQHGVETIEAVVVLGSGWASIRDSIGLPKYKGLISELPGFVRPVADGHLDEYQIREFKGYDVLVLCGRTHLYEGMGTDQVVHGIRAAKALGASVCLLTNANGSLRPDWRLGQAILIRDHINLSLTSPLEGSTFVDLTDCWDEKLRVQIRLKNPDLQEGIYAFLRGPSYQTPAETVMLQTFGADMVGMSGVLEAIAAHAIGIKVLGISLVSSLELSTEAIDPLEVVRIASSGAQKCTKLIEDVINLSTSF